MDLFHFFSTVLPKSRIGKYASDKIFTAAAVSDVFCDISYILHTNSGFMVIRCHAPLSRKFQYV